eukprot:Skav235143  [mRNA]  locus=scaffold1072:54894:59036:- [translate_table: standard]
MGGMGIGCAFLGGHTKVAVDHNQLAVEHLRANLSCTVLQADITSPGSAKMIHQSFDGTPGTTTFGFPCQPFSTQGLRLGTRDERALVFWAGLQIVFLTQSQTAILECVQGAGCDGQIQDALQSLAHAMNFDILTVNLDLAVLWPCRRARWWALLLPKEWNVIGMDTWTPSSTFATCGDLFRCWGAWSQPDEEDLQLYAFELEAYTDRAYGADPRILDLTSVANTFLHSYGNALTGCPCLCRTGPFSRSSLLSKGLRGCFVQSRVHGNPRYLHPREVALLQGVPDSIQYVHNPRSSLALLGLVASPMQMVWVYGHLRFNEACHFGTDLLPHPRAWLEAYQQELLRQTEGLFDELPEVLPQILLLHDAQGDPLAIVSPSATTVGQLLMAQRITLRWNEAGGVAMDGSAIPLDQLMDRHTGPYHLTSDVGLSERPRPNGLFMVAIQHKGDLLLSIVECGQFLFQALRQLGLNDVNFLVDAHGKVYGADFRVWTTLKLSTLDPLLWPPRYPCRLHAAGEGNPELGLHDGQIWHALQRFAMAICGHDQPLLVHPQDADALLRGSTRLVTQFDQFWNSNGQILCIFAFNDHWTLLRGLAYEDHIHWCHCDGLTPDDDAAARKLAFSLSTCLGVTGVKFQSQSLYQQRAPHTCGTIALLHACALLGFHGLFTEEQILDMHLALRQCSWTFEPDLEPYLHGQGPPDVQTQLATLLVTKGVPGPLASDRAAAAIQKLGVSPVQQALRSQNQWQALKALTTKPGAGFQFVQRDELQAYIDQRARSKHGATVSKQKKDKKPTRKNGPAPWNLDPSLLDIDPKHFVDADDDAVPQIQLSQVVADARGLAVCTAAEAAPYILETKNISTDALGLLITEDIPREARANATIASMRFPVTYRPTKDPLLVSGCLLQLGDLEIKRHVSEDPTEDMDVTTTRVLKLQIYRDELPAEWNAIVDSPIRVLIQKVPMLRLCQVLHCKHDCGHFHASVEEPLDNVLYEIWGRRFQTMEGRISPAGQAEVFQAFLRVAQSAVSSLLPTLVDGIYFEPRCDGSRGTDTGYSVVWIPGATREIALHKLKLSSHGITLVRMKQRFGIRIHDRYEEATHNELRPGEDYHRVTVTYVYRLHPLPHGLQRAQISKLLREWNWEARPLQPSRGTAEGGAWDVGASCEPPSNTMTAFNADVLVTLMKDKQTTDKQATVVGPRRVQRHLLKSRATTGSAASSDPWQDAGKDPWCQWQGVNAAPAPQAPIKRLDAITEKLKSDVQASVTQAQSSSIPADAEARFHKLETGMTELRQQGQKFHHWFEETGKRLSHQDQNLQQVQQHLTQQQIDIGKVREEVHASHESLKLNIGQSLHSVKKELSQEIDHTLTTQMDRFEKLLFAKSPRKDRGE